MSKYKVYLSEDGRVTRTEQEGAIFSRSNLVNTLVVYSPLPSDYLIRAGFTRADGVRPHSQFLYYVGQQDGYSCYEYNLTSYQLGVPGALGLTFDIFKANEDAVLTTATTMVQVGTSFAPVVDDEPTDDAYTSQIETAMEQFQQAVSLANKTVDARPTYNSKNLVESGGVKDAIDDAKFEFQEELNNMNSHIFALYDSKQDVLVAGDGIKIEGNVISAIGGGAPSGFKVKYYDGEYSFHFFTEEKLSNSDELFEYLGNNGYNYDNPLPIYDVLYNGCVDSLEESAGLYEEAGDLYVRVPAYDDNWYVYTDGFDFSDNGSSEGGGGNYSDEMTNYNCYIGETWCSVPAPVGLHGGEDLYDWLVYAGYVNPDPGVQVSCEFGYAEMKADTSSNAIRIYDDGEVDSCLASEVYDFYDSNQP